MQQVQVIMCGMNTAQDVIHEIFTRLLAEPGATHESLAQKMGKPSYWVSRWAQGKPKELPPPEDLKAICLVSGVSMRTLLERIGYLDPEEMEPGVAYVIRDGEARKDLLDAIKDFPDDDVRGIIAGVEGMRNFLHRMRGVPDTGGGSAKVGS